MTELHLAKRIRDRIRLTPALPAMGYETPGGWKSISYGELGKRIDAVASWLIDEGVQRGDRVAIFSAKSPSWSISDLAITLLVTTHYMDEAERCTDIGYIHLSKLLVCGKPGKLKQAPSVTPAGTCRYEIRVANPATYLADLRSFEPVLDATLFGETIHLMVSDSCAPGTLVDKVRQRGGVAEIHSVPPSLEDVFISRIR